MAEGEDWLYRPILRGIARAESLEDPAFDLGLFVEWNEALDVETENQYRLHKR